MAAPHNLSPVETGTLDHAKRAMRAAALAARAGQAPQAAGMALTALVLRACPPPSGAVVSGFWPLQGEIDITPLLSALHERGHAIVLPVTPRRGLPLSFRLWRPGDPLVAERFGTLRATGEERSPEFLLVPLLVVRPERRTPWLWCRILRPHAAPAHSTLCIGLRVRGTGSARGADGAARRSTECRRNRTRNHPLRVIMTRLSSPRQDPASAWAGVPRITRRCRYPAATG